MNEAAEGRQRSKQRVFAARDYETGEHTKAADFLTDQTDREEHQHRTCRVSASRVHHRSAYTQPVVLDFL